MIKVIKKLGFKTYLGDDENEYFCSVDVNSLYLDSGLERYEIIDGDIKEISYDQSELDDATTQKEMEEQNLLREKEAIKNASTMYSILKSLQLKVFEQEAMIESLQAQLLATEHAAEIKEQFTFEDTLDDMTSLNQDNCVNYKHKVPKSNDIDGIVRPINKNEDMVLETIDLGPTMGALKDFRIIGHGAVPEYGYGLFIELLNMNGDNIQMYDENDVPQPYVVYGIGSSLSGKMHTNEASPPTSYKFKITIKLMAPQSGGVPFISAFSVVYTKS